MGQHEGWLGYVLSMYSGEKIHNECVTINASSKSVQQDECRNAARASVVHCTTPTIAVGTLPLL